MQRASCTQHMFTQDGKRFDELSSSTISPSDLECARARDLQVRMLIFKFPSTPTRITQVGWACRKCVTVFQNAAGYDQHQQMLCHSERHAFALIQTHYECVRCTDQATTQNKRFGTQAEYRAHCATGEHKRKHR
ncbi:unnamed protein product [Sphagnum balticum]